MENISKISKNISKILIANMSKVLTNISKCISNISKNISMKNTHEDSLRRVDFKFSSNMLTVAILSDSGEFLQFAKSPLHSSYIDNIPSICFQSEHRL